MIISNVKMDVKRTDEDITPGHLLRIDRVDFAEIGRYDERDSAAEECEQSEMKNPKKETGRVVAVCRSPDTGLLKRPVDEILIGPVIASVYNPRRKAARYLMSRSSTSKMRVAFGGITPPAPRLP
jgi:hypothetical protein